MAARPDEEGLVYALLGHPVQHSLSPPMQNAAFQAANVHAVYIPLDVPPERLHDTLRGLHAAGVAGLNLTAPHKEAAWEFLSGATEEASRVRAVNTLRREAGGWRGHATDGLGFRDWIQELGIAVAGARVIVMGAGGAARSLAPVLESLQPGSVDVVSRDRARAASLVEAFGPVAGGWSARALADAPGAGVSPGRDLLIRALASDAIDDAEGAWWKRLGPGAVVLELNYGARASASRARAASEGRRFEDGLGLLLHQGAHSYEFWRGERAPIEAMRRALLESAG